MFISIVTLTTTNYKTRNKNCFISVKDNNAIFHGRESRDKNKNFFWSKKKKKKIKTSTEIPAETKSSSGQRFFPANKKITKVFNFVSDALL
jgi:hypothetical protein